MVPETGPEVTEATVVKENQTIKYDLPTRADEEAIRRSQWKHAVEQELQILVSQASVLREKINTAKTNYKKQFYGKKFSKVQTQVMQMVAALQRFQANEQATAPTPVTATPETQVNANETPAAA